MGLAVTSGAAAGLANQLFKFGHDWLADRRTKEGQRRELEHQATMQERELHHQRDLQREEREHQAAVRREDVFFEAQKELLPKVVAVRSWIQWWWGELYGGEVDYHPVSLHRPEAVQTPADAIRALEQVAGSHPSKAVRVYARELFNSIDGTVNMPDHYGNSDPTVDELSNWSQRAAELVDALHDPEYAPKKIERKRPT